MEHRFNFFRVCILYCFFSILPSYGTEGSMIPRYLRFTRLRNCSATQQQIYFGIMESQPTRLRSILYPELSFPLCATKSNGLLLQIIKKNNVFDSWNVLWFTCIERSLNGFLDIQDACTAQQIINKCSRSLHLL